MSRRRIKPNIPSKRGPDGRPRCRWCRNPVERPRRTFCSDICVHEWKLRRDPGYVRQCVYHRDNGICRLCGRDCVAWALELQLLRRQDFARFTDAIMRERIPLRRIGGKAESALWDADHIVEVADGGGECGLEGYQTSCIVCHRTKTTDRCRARRERTT